MNGREGRDVGCGRGAGGPTSPAGTLDPAHRGSGTGGLGAGAQGGPQLCESVRVDTWWPTQKGYKHLERPGASQGLWVPGPRRDGSLVARGRPPPPAGLGGGGSGEPNLLIALDDEANSPRKPDLPRLQLHRQVGGPDLRRGQSTFSELQAATRRGDGPLIPG